MPSSTRLSISSAGATLHPGSTGLGKAKQCRVSAANEREAEFLQCLDPTRKVVRQERLLTIFAVPARQRWTFVAVKLIPGDPVAILIGSANSVVDDSFRETLTRQFGPDKPPVACHFALLVARR